MDISEKGFDARVRGPFWKRALTWAAPFLISVCGGGVLGYYEGLKQAAARVAALELAVDAAKELLRQQAKDADHFAVVQRDHDRRLLRIEDKLKLEPELVVKP